MRLRRGVEARVRSASIEVRPLDESASLVSQLLAMVIVALHMIF